MSAPTTAPGTVDAAQAAAHLDALAAAGVSRWQVVRLTGLHHTTVYRLQPGQPCYAHTAARILAIPLPHTPHAVVGDSGLVPALGSTRRLQGLAALGWPMRELAARMGCHVSHLCDLSRGEVERVTAARARAIAKLYDRLSGTPGPSRRTVILSRKRGWAPPLAWECECIEECACPSRVDDPMAEPVGVGLGKRRNGFTREVYDELRVLGYSDPLIADMMGITHNSLRRQLAPSRRDKAKAS